MVLYLYPDPHILLSLDTPVVLMGTIGKWNPELQLEKNVKTLKVSHNMLFEPPLQHAQMAS